MHNIMYIMLVMFLGACELEEIAREVQTSTIESELTMYDTKVTMENLMIDLY